MLFRNSRQKEHRKECHQNCETKKTATCTFVTSICTWAWLQEPHHRENYSEENVCDQGSAQFFSISKTPTTLSGICVSIRQRTTINIHTTLSYVHTLGILTLDASHILVEIDLVIILRRKDSARFPIDCISIFF